MDVEGEKNKHWKSRGPSRQQQQHWRSMSWTGEHVDFLDDGNPCYGHESKNAQNNVDNISSYRVKNLTINSIIEEVANESNCNVIAPQVALLCPPLQSLFVSPQQIESSSTNSNLINATLKPQKSMRSGTLNIRLDLGAVQRESYEGEDNGDDEIIQKKKRMMQCDQECSQVSSHLYFGSNMVAQNYDLLHACKITHILNCVGFECPEYFSNDFYYKTLWLQDHPSEDIISILYNVFDYFENVREQGGRVFVHCIQGVSRSASLIIAYLMWQEQRTYEDILEKVKTIRCVVSPNMGFAFQLLQWQTRVLPNISYDTSSTTTSLPPPSSPACVRLYRMAPYSPFDPSHLVPKCVASPTISSLDTRGAFLLLLQQGIFIWRGKLCAKNLMVAADRAAFQFIHYEHVPGPIVFIREGNEPREVCKVLHTNDSKGKVSSSNHELQNNEYSSDFDILHRMQIGTWVAPTLRMGQLPSRNGNWHIKDHGSSKQKLEG